MLWSYIDVRFTFTMAMSCKKLLHVRFCGDAADNYGSLMVSREFFRGEADEDCRWDDQMSWNC